MDISEPRPCRKCGSTFAGRQCLTCKKKRDAEWYVKNRDRVLAANNAWNTANKPRVAELSAARYSSNIEEKRRHNTEYYAANAEAIKERGRRYFKENPEVFRVSRNNRRARLLNSKGSLSRGLASKLFKLQRGKCACCGLPLGGNYHLDHIMPLALGGENTDSNIQLLRQKCNSQKHAKHPVDFMQSRGFLL